MNQPETKAAIDAVSELLDAHFREAEDCADEDGKFSLGFRVCFDRSHSPTRLKVTCRVAKVTTDEIECSVDDPAQRANGEQALLVTTRQRCPAEPNPIKRPPRLR